MKVKFIAENKIIIFNRMMMMISRWFSYGGFSCSYILWSYFSCMPSSSSSWESPAGRTSTHEIWLSSNINFWKTTFYKHEWFYTLLFSGIFTPRGWKQVRNAQKFWISTILWIFSLPQPECFYKMLLFAGEWEHVNKWQIS